MPMEPRRVLITGAAGGIGLEIGRTFLAAGDRVQVCDADPEAVAALALSDSGIGAAVVDISDAAAAQDWVRRAEAALGGIDVLVDCAGVGGPTKPIEELGLDEWQRVLDVNLTGTFAVTQAAVPALRRSSQGRIIVLSSLAGRTGYPNRLSYAVTKWGLVGLVKTLSIELGGDGVTVNAIQPGAVDGERVRSVVRGRAEASGRSFDEEWADAMANRSIRRPTPPQDIAALCLFLASPAAGTISGQAIPIDGDSQHA